MEARRIRSRRAAVLGGLLGALLSAALARPDSGGGERPGVPRLWAADREGGALVGLDGEFFEVVSVPLDRPLHVAATPGGGAWVAYGEGARRLAYVDGLGEIRLEVELPSVLDLATLGNDAIVLVRASRGTGRILRIGSPPVRPFGSSLGREAGRRPLALHRMASRILGVGDDLLVADRRGALARIRCRPRPVLEARGPGGEAVRDLAVSRQGVWVLEGRETARLHLLDTELAKRWSRSVDADATSLAIASPSGEAWVACPGAGVVRRFSRDGGCVASSEPLGLGSAGALAESGGEGVYAAAPGAIFLLDRAGGVLSSQGGFDGLVDLSSVPGGARRSGSRDAPRSAVSHWPSDPPRAR